MGRINKYDEDGDLNLFYQTEKEKQEGAPIELPDHIKSAYKKGMNDAFDHGLTGTPYNWRGTKYDINGQALKTPNKSTANDKRQNEKVQRAKWLYQRWGDRYNDRSMTGRIIKWAEKGWREKNEEGSYGDSRSKATISYGSIGSYRTIIYKLIEEGEI